MLKVVDAARHAQLIVLRLLLQFSDNGYGDALWIDIFAGGKTEGLEGKRKSRMYESYDPWDSLWCLSFLFVRNAWGRVKMCSKRWEDRRMTSL